MSRKRGTGRQYIRLKSEMKDISAPYNFEHHYHVGPEDYGEKVINTDVQTISHRPPNPDTKDRPRGPTITNESLLQTIKKERTPTVSSEIGDIVEERMRKVLSEQNWIHEIGHCSHCLSVETPKDEQVMPLHTQQDVKLNTCTKIPVPTKRNQFSSSQQNRMHRQGGSVKFDERECLADALKYHIDELVEGVVFKDSELPDALLQDGCITDDECARVRNKLDRKDQVRVLVSVLKGRDLDVLQKFLKRLRSQNHNLVKSIEEKFESNKKSELKGAKCALCKLTSQVHLKYIVDNLWKNGLIDDVLHYSVVDIDTPLCYQDGLWKSVIDSLNNCCVRNPSDVCNKIVDALTKKQHYKHIAEGIKEIIKNKGTLVCVCRLHFINVSTLSLSSRVSSCSPYASDSEISNITETSNIQEGRRCIVNQPYQTVSKENSYLGNEVIGEFVSVSQASVGFKTVQENMIFEEQPDVPEKKSVKTMVKLFEHNS
ncbi:uncharacterized protein LOC123530152 [Mercenaria mercenaria]|uniref:uncharacterized protein LOC123530152 n=1 Tax=Mercenaria mercenaria TaxID=6596 RepID=UPI001E1D4F50|nr:uncharacterized protein LOC123530152 [Mercenaria mercenaria]